MHCFSVFFVAFTEVIVRRILIINNAMKVSSKSLSGGLLPPDVPTVDKLDLGLVLIRKSECESLMIPAFILLNITPAVWTLGAWQWPRVCRVLGSSRPSWTLLHLFLAGVTSFSVAAVLVCWSGLMSRAETYITWIHPISIVTTNGP